MNVVPIVSRKSSPLPADFPGILRALADRIESGEVTQFVGLAVSEEYEFLFPSSLHESLVLASLLQHRAAAKFGVGSP